MIRYSKFVNLRFASPVPSTRPCASSRADRPPSTVHRPLFLVFALLLAALPARALDVSEPLWNFDGHVVPEHFNLLSVRVSNPLPTPFDGTLRLSQNNGLEENVGAAYVEPCYLSAFGSRWVQFQVYVGSETRWRLAWGTRKGESLDLPEPRMGAPVRVLLTDAESLRAVRTSFRTFPDQLFPPSVAALDGLHSVLLDYAPRWEAARRAAFVDWLHGGGSVHLLTDAQGRFPVFSDELAVLNTTATSTRVGAGRVVRHRKNAADIDESQLSRAGFGAPHLEENKETLVYQLSGAVLPALGQMAKPEHCWWLIGLLALLYVLAVGPGVFLLGRHRRDYRIALLALGGCVVCFGLLFSIVGRRGQGEAGKVSSLAYARALDDGQYLVTQWIDLFVTHGDYYTLSHPAPHNLYAVPQDFEHVNGVVLCGKDGQFRVDIPMFSQRSFLHQARLEGAHCEVRAEKWPADHDLRPGKLVAGAGFPSEPLAIWATCQGRVWTLQLRNHRLEADADGATFETFFARDKIDTGFSYGYGPSGQYPTLEELARKKAPTLLAWGLGGTKVLRQWVDDPAEHDRLRVFVLAASPPGFRLRGTPRIGAESGYVLYAFEVVPPAGKGD